MTDQQQQTEAAGCLSAVDRLVGRIRVTYRSDVVGSGVFWEGPPIGIPGIRNFVARDLAERVAADGKSRTDGMWMVDAVPNVKLTGGRDDATAK